MNASTKKWNDVWDDRRAVAEAAGAEPEELDRFLDAFFAAVFSKTETNFVGYAKFEWIPVRGRTPDGVEFVSRRLRVTPSRYAETPAKSAPVLGELSTDLSTCVDIEKEER